MIYLANIKEGFEIYFSKKYRAVRGGVTLYIEHIDIFHIAGSIDQIKEITKLFFLVLESLKFDENGELKVYKGDIQELLMDLLKNSYLLYEQTYLVLFIHYSYKKRRKTLVLYFYKIPENIVAIFKSLNERRTLWSTIFLMRMISQKNLS